jgi:hypothetical protein
VAVVIQGRGHGRKSWLWVAAALVAACGGDTPPELEALYGTWEWTGTSGGIAGESRSPRPDDPRITITFGKDGNAVFRRDGTVTREQRFRVANEATVFDTAEAPVLYYDDEDLGRAVEIDAAGTTLTLSDNVYDGFFLSYRRVVE